MPKISEERKKMYEKMAAKIKEIEKDFPYGYAKKVLERMSMEATNANICKVNNVVSGRSHRLDIYETLLDIAQEEKERKKRLFG